MPLSEYRAITKKKINSHEAALLGWKKKKARRACVYRRVSYKLLSKVVLVDITRFLETGECKVSCQPFVMHISEQKMDRFVKKVHSR